MDKFKFSFVMERLMQVFGVANESELARAANINRQTIASWKRRESIPYAECISIAIKRSISLDWLFLGNGEMYSTNLPETKIYSAQSQQTPKTSENKTSSYRADRLLSLEELNILKSFNELTDSEKASFQLMIEEKKRLSLIEKQLSQLSLELNKIIK